MGSQSYLCPLFAQVFLTFSVLMVLAYRRLGAISRGEYPIAYFKLMQKREGFPYPEKVEATARNFINLFEVPVLLYALVPLLLVTQQNDILILWLLWGFVGLRAAHSWVHLTSNHIRFRFISYLASSTLLLLAWLKFCMNICA